MYAHLNKKINVPNCNKVRSIAWSSDHDFIACGGDNGVLKVIKLENNLSSPAAKVDSSKNFSHNQTLESHKSTIQYVCWNEPFQKLTSSDESGSIIVWMLYKGMWYEEMVNNRNKSLVTGMAWTFDGQKICIVYEDGAIITGSVDGTRIWGKEIKNVNLTRVEWSPDGKIILIGTNDLEIQIFDSSGNFVKKIPLSTLQTMYGRSNSYKDIPKLVCIKWFKKQTTERPLLIAFEDGWLQLMKNERDDLPVLVNTGLKLSSVEWNYTGEVFAVTGNEQVEEGVNKNFLNLYNQEGEVLQVVKVPGNEIFDCSWHRSGLKMALAVDSYIFFASVKPNYQWGYLCNSVVFALPITSNSSSRKKKLIFWELKTNTPYEKEVTNFSQLTTWLHCCAVVARSDNASEGKRADIYSLSLFNSVGTLIDRHLVSLRVKHCCLNSSRMIVASEDSFFVWHFDQPFSGSSGNKNVYNERLFNELTLHSEAMETTNQKSATLLSTSDPITCITASEKNFLIAQQSGTINQFLLPSATRVHQIQTDCIPFSLALNRASSKLALIDKSAKLHIYDFDANNEETSKEGDWLDVKMQDVWDMKWAADNNDMLAICEKNRLTIVNGSKLEREEPVPFSGYVCLFEQLCVKTILLDNLVVDSMDSRAIQIDGYFDSVQSQAVRELKDIVNHSLTDAVNYALQWPNFPSLWNIIAEQSLDNLQLETANLAMVKHKDYKGVQLVKKLNKLSDNALKRAEVCAYFGRFEEAEAIYLEQNRPDLAIHLYKVTGNYGRVLELLQRHHTGSYEKESEMCHLSLGEHYAEQYQWARAAEHFEKVSASEQLVPCYIHMHNYHGLISLVDSVRDESLLADIGIFLQSMGLCKESVRALVKANRPEQAIKLCISMSEWKLALDLAHHHRIEHIDSILSQYVSHLTADRKYIEIIEVYRKANKISDATAMVMTVISELKKAKKGDAILFKKLFVLIGLLCKENRSNTSGSNTLEDLLSTDEIIPFNADRKMVEDPWKGAEAYHFLLLTQRHLYEGYFDLAMKSALHLQDYEQFLTTEEIYSLVALSSYSCKCFPVCSKAFIKLEAISTDSEVRWNAAMLMDESDSQEWTLRTSEMLDQRDKYEKLAVDIFASKLANEPQMDSVECKFCGTSIPDYSTSCSKCNTKFLPCIASGKSIMDSRLQWVCKQCAHQAIKSELTQSYCPLCHFRID